MAMPRPVAEGRHRIARRTTANPTAMTQPGDDRASKAPNPKPGGARGHTGEVVMVAVVVIAGIVFFYRPFGYRPFGFGASRATSTSAVDSPSAVAAADSIAR